MLAPTPVVSVVMVAFGGGWQWVPRALQALHGNTAETYEVILVDNGGAEDRPALDDPSMSTSSATRHNLGFGEGSNQGASRARSDVLVFLNTDALVEPGWLPPLLERVAEDGVGAAFPGKLNLDGTMQEAGAFVTGEANAYVFGDGEDADGPEYAFPREVDFGSAAAMCVTRSRFDFVSGFDPAYRLAYYEDADLCFRLRGEGLRNVYEPRSRVMHARSVSALPADLADVTSRTGTCSWAAGETSSRIGRLTTRSSRIGGRRLEARDVHARHRALLRRN